MPRYNVDRKVKVAIPQGVEVKLSALGVDVVVTSDAQGQFRGRHRDEGIGSGDFDSMRRAIERIETEASQKRERARRLKEAATSPEPALLYRSGTVQPLNRRRHAQRGRDADVAATLEPINVRGIDKRSGLALIIRENGDKESMTWDLICRPLAGVEKKKLLDLAEKEQRATKEIPQPPTVDDVMDTLPGVDIEATWDADREVWVVMYDREELIAPPTYSARDQLESRVTARLIVKHTPYRFTDENARGKGGRRMRAVELVRYADGEGFTRLAGYDNLYKTAADVDALDAAIRASERAAEKRADYLSTLLFDRSIFPDE